MTTVNSDPTATPATQVFDSALDRARLRLHLEEMRKDLEGHFAEDKQRHSEVDGKLDELLAMRSQIRLLIAVVLVVGGGIIATARWTVSHAVSDALIEKNIIRYERNP